MTEQSSSRSLHAASGDAGPEPSPRGRFTSKMKQQADVLSLRCEVLFTVPTIPAPGGHVKEKLTQQEQRRNTLEVKIAFPFSLFNKKPYFCSVSFSLPNHSGVLSAVLLGQKATRAACASEEGAVSFQS